MYVTAHNMCVCRVYTSSALLRLSAVLQRDEIDNRPRNGSDDVEGERPRSIGLGYL